MHIIDKVNEVDGGLYTCIAGNFMGQATASAFLEVNDSSARQTACPFVLVMAALLSGH